MLCPFLGLQRVCHHHLAWLARLRGACTTVLHVMPCSLVARKGEGTHTTYSCTHSITESHHSGPCRVHHEVFCILEMSLLLCLAAYCCMLHPHLVPLHCKCSPRSCYLCVFMLYVCVYIYIYILYTNSMYSYRTVQTPVTM